MKFRLLITCIALIACAAPAHAAPPSAESYYAAALEKMRAEPVPPNATYSVDVTTSGASFVATKVNHGEVAVAFEVGKGIKPMPHVAAAYRGSDHLTAIDTDKGCGTTHSPFFDPTWTGIYDWMHYGWDGPSKEQLARERRREPMQSAEPATIATVKAFGVAYYRVIDAGAARCANGDDGHHVRLIALSRPDLHPLTDATIDVRTQELCNVRLGFHQEGPLSANGLIAMDLGKVNGYAIVTGEDVQFNVHVLGLQLKHISAKVTYSDLAFPQRVPQADFSS